MGPLLTYLAILFVCLVVLIMLILNVILLVKVWQMSNDVRALKKKYASSNNDDSQK